MKTVLAAILCLVCCVGRAAADVKTQTVSYRIGDTIFRSVLVWDDAVQGRRPGILVCPEWWGLDGYAKHRAEMLARLGYVALAADLYGDGTATEDPQEAGKLSGALKSHREVLRARAAAALAQLAGNPNVDPAKLGVIGYCFGGTTALELARSGADVKAVVTFHAGLDSPDPAAGKNIHGRVLVCHGGNDTFSSPKDIAAFENEMRVNHVDWQMNVYGNAVHSFTNPDADRHGIPGIAYNAKADHRSWAAMQALFKDVFGSTGER